jgi:hypothetical protein
MAMHGWVDSTLSQRRHHVPAGRRRQGDCAPGRVPRRRPTTTKFTVVRRWCWLSSGLGRAHSLTEVSKQFLRHAIGVPNGSAHSQCSLRHETLITIRVNGYLQRIPPWECPSQPRFPSRSWNRSMAMSSLASRGGGGGFLGCKSGLSASVDAAITEIASL